MRSSGAAEDLPDASYAGLYETYLSVPVDGSADAVRRCLAAATSERVIAYHQRHSGGGAWTPLFARAAAVVTLAAHASLVAREYAIPAVVGTGDATARLNPGQLVTVDGSAGTVTPHGEPVAVPAG